MTPSRNEYITQRKINTEPPYNILLEFYFKIEDSADIWKETGADRAICMSPGGGSSGTGTRYRKAPDGSKPPPSAI